MMKTVPNSDNDSQIPDVNVEDRDTGNDTVEQLTDHVYFPEKTDKVAEPICRGVVLKIQPLNDIEIDIWSNKVGCYYHFKAKSTTSKENGTSLPKNSEEINGRPISLRGQKVVNYTSMLTSDVDSEVDT